MTEESEPEAGPPLSMLTSSLLRSSPDLAAALAREIDDKVPAYRGHGRLGESDLRDSCAAHIDFVCSATTPTAERKGRVRAIGAARFGAGIALADVLGAVRVGSQFLWGAIVDFARATGGATDAQLVAVSGQVWTLSGDFAELLGAGYREAEQTQLIDSQRERYALIDTILRGHDEHAPTFWQAIDRLGVPRDRPYVVAAIETRVSGQLPTPGLEQRLQEEGVFSIWLLRGEVELGMVVATPDRLAVLRAALERYRVRGGIGPVTTNLAHTPQAVRLAQTALASAGPDQVALFADAAIPTMAAGAPDVAGAVAAIVFDQVSALPEAERALVLEAARHWFASGGQVAEAARRMFVHPNTVRNRLRRLETLTSRSLSDPRQAAEIYLALVSTDRAGGLGA